MGVAFESVGVATNSPGISQTVVQSSLLLLYARDDTTGVRSGAMKALVDATTRVDRAAIEASDLILSFL